MEEAKEKIKKVETSLKLGITLTAPQVDQLIAAMEQHAVEAPALELTPANWEAEFGEDGMVQTPLGNAKMGENQYFKMVKNGRQKEFGMVKPTLANPDVILEVPSEAIERQSTERPSSYLFIKTFNVNGEKVKFYTSVTVSKEGLEVVISNHYIEPKQVRAALTAGRLLYQHPDMALRPSAPDPALLRQPAEADNTAGTSTSKGTNNPQTAKENLQKAALANPTTIMPRSAKTVSEAQELIRPLVGKPINNKKLGITGTISGKSLGKLGSPEATKQSVSPELHAKAVANIDILFENAEFDVAHPDTHNRNEVEKAHRLGALMFDEANGEYVPVMLTIIEYKKDGNRIYNVEAVDIEAKEKPTGLMTASNPNAVRQVPIVGFASHDSKASAIHDFSAKVRQLIETANKNHQKNFLSQLK